MVVHCIKCGIIGLTKTKREALDWEYEGFQWWMQFGIDPGILSQHKAAKGHYYQKDSIKYKDYPLVVPHCMVWYRFKNTKLTPHWVKISVRKRKGIGVWLPIKPHKPLPDIQYLRDSLMVRNRKGDYEFRLIYDVPQQLVVPKEVLAVDLGERVMATVCGSGYRAFLGREVRGIRRHYAWLRRRLGQKKLLGKIRQIGSKERNKVRNVLHHVANQVVSIAEQTRAIIVIGQLKGIRRVRTSKRLNRIVFNMPYYTLTKMIQYKAAQRGIQVFLVDERGTSMTCHRCGNADRKQRKSQGLFVCSRCSLEYNADLNGARNIMDRAGEQGFLARALAEALKSGSIPAQIST